MLTEKEYENLKAQNKLASENNDYSKMIMIGDKNYLAMKEYEQSVCKHNGAGYIKNNDCYCGICNKILN